MSESNGNLQVTDLEITVDVAGGPLDGQTLVYPVLIVRMCASLAEDRVPLPEKDGKVTATPAFLVELDKEIRRAGYSCTVGIALNVWLKACEIADETQKKTESMHQLHDSTASTPGNCETASC